MSVGDDQGATDGAPARSSRGGSILLKSRVANFLPALAVTLVWLWVVTWPDGGTAPSTTLGEEIWEFYPMMLAMVAGSLIAGSTPLGGGVVAFPVAVLCLSFKPSQGRDFAVLIQSVGMNAAAYLIILRKRHLVNFDQVACFVLAGLPGVFLGLRLDLPPFSVMLTFQVLVMNFALIFFYFSALVPTAVRELDSLEAPPRDRDADDHSSASQPRASTQQLALVYGTMCLIAFVGGFLSANVGSGADIMLYAFGKLCWNMLVPPGMQVSESSLTASSVIVMGLVSLATALSRALTVGITRKVLVCWAATSWIVCWGAPLGSLLLTPMVQGWLRLALYVLAVLQFAGFAALKIGDRMSAWVFFGATSLAVIGLLTLHAAVSRRRLREQGMKLEGLSLTVVKSRLLSP